MATNDAQLNPGALPGDDRSEPWNGAEYPPDVGEKQKSTDMTAVADEADGNGQELQRHMQSPQAPAQELPTPQANDASALRAETSRQNGRKSRGPQTRDGKNRSRRSALKHGLRAETLLLEAGNQEENNALQALRARLEQQFLPSTVEQQLFLETAVHALWQKQRGLQFEARELRQDLVFHGPVMDRILRYGTAADKRFFRSLAELKRLQEEDADGDPDE
ncbi:MAG: hypothetical protein ABSF85_11705 [Terriglobales bacterium]|jgi:hypothetical protein